MALGVEDVEGIVDTHGEAKVVKVDVAGAVAVDSTDINDELLVDEHPDIIVTRESERFAAHVGEYGVDLGREVVDMSQQWAQFLRIRGLLVGSPKIDPKSIQNLASRGDRVAAHPGLGGQGMGFSSWMRGAREDHGPRVAGWAITPIAW